MAIELRLQFIGAGNFQARTPTDIEEANEEFEPGEILHAKLTRPKTSEQNNYLHALIQVAYENQRKKDRLQSWRHLRAELLIEAGWCTVDYVPLQGWDAKTVAGVLRPTIALVKRRAAEAVRVVYVQSEERVYVYSPKSWARASIDDASRVLDKVSEIIVTKIVPGLDLELLRREAKARIERNPNAKAKPKAKAARKPVS